MASSAAGRLNLRLVVRDRGARLGRHLVTTGSVNVDVWSRWMLHDRFGGDQAMMQQTLAGLTVVRDRILDRAGELGNAVVLDVGAGDGLLGFGALQRTRGRVIFADISDDLLDRARTIAQEHEVVDRCQFVSTDAASLEGIDDASVDAVVLRSVLIYVDDKRAAFEAFGRVLRPGGRLSLFEPINRVWSELNSARFHGLDVAPVAHLIDKVSAVYSRHARPAMMDFDELDLVRLARDVGFDPIAMEFEVANYPGRLGAMSWAGFLSLRPNPLAPSTDEAIAEALDPPERDRLEQHLRPMVEAGAPTNTWYAGAYLGATKRDRPI